MTDAQRHRGPDDQGFAAFSLGSSFASSGGDRAPAIDPILRRETLAADAAPGFEGGFGFNRLSIRDLSSHGHQPMVTRDRRVVIVFNGEIYDADDHRAPLEREGHVFSGTSDTEVLLALYQRHGLDGMLARINGMFAFAIADLGARRLFLGRDRLGIKPLYVWQSGGVLAAASEVKSFLRHPAFAARLDDDAFAETMAFRSTAKDRHLLAGVRQVEPGGVLEIAGREVRARRYWQVKTDAATAPTSARAFEAAAREVEAQIEQSVKMQLVSDVPVGCQFSGGLDSSMVSAFANRHTKTSGHYQSFSILVDDPRFDEERWIDAANTHLGVSGYKYRFGEDEFASRLERATWHLDQPLDHMNSLGIMLLAERSRAHVTVLLSGEGADELFGGYGRFLRALYRPYLAPVSGVSARLGATIPSVVQSKLAAFGSDRGDGDRDWFIRASSPVLPSFVEALTGKASLYDSAMDLRRAMFPSDGTFVARCRAYELETFLVGLLNRQDKMTMAHSLENRVPLLDHALVELVAKLPDSFSVALRPSRAPLERNTKRILKRVAERHFPESFVYRKKEGFGMPLARYLRSRAMRPIVERAILSAERRGLVDAKTMRRYWKEELDQPFVSEALWIAVSFEMWASQVLDGDRAALDRAGVSSGMTNGVSALA